MNTRTFGRRRLTIAVAPLLLSLYAATAAAGQTVKMDIKSYAFTQADLTVTPGTTVVWTNRDESPHTVTSRDKKFDSKALDTNDEFRFTFKQAGDFPYVCTLHPQMIGVVHVVAKK